MWSNASLSRDSRPPLITESLLNFKGLFRNADLKGDDSPLYALISLRHFIDPGKWADTKYDNPLDLPEEYGNLMGFDLETILANQKAGTEASECFVELLKRTDKFYAELKEKGALVRCNSFDNEYFSFDYDNVLYIVAKECE